MRYFYFLLFCSTIANGQVGTITGRVVQEQTGLGVAYATVALLSSKDSTFVKGEIADSTGRFMLGSIREGTYILEVSSIEFKKAYRGPLVLDSTVNSLELAEIKMQTEERNLREVIIKGERPAFEKHFDKTVINVASNSLFKTSINASDILRRSPGIGVGADGSVTLRNNVSPMVLIDGKPVPMSKEELANYLNSLMQDQIESIEVIENPSARYDAEYKGVINIRLKRDKNLGWNGNISGYGLRNSLNSAGAGLTAGYKTKKISYYATYWYNDNRSHYKNTGTQFVQNQQELRSNLNIPGGTRAHSYQLGADYAFAKRQTFGLLYKGFNSVGNTPSFNITRLLNSQTLQELSSISTNNAQKSGNDNQTVNANYRAELGSNMLSVDASYAHYKSSQTQNISNYSNAELVGRLRSNTDIRIKIKSAQVDYSFKLKQGRVELGSKLAQTSSYNNLRFDTLSKNENWIVDPRRTNEFKYNESIIAGYVSYSRSIGNNLNLQVGLRGENTKANGNSVNSTEAVQRSYFKFLPNVKFGYHVNKDALLSVAYTRRLERPSFYYLNPFQLYLSPYMYAEGNPFLLPTINNTANVVYSVKEFSSTVSFRKDISIVSQIPLLDSVTNITLYTRQNTGDRATLAWDANYQFKLSSWWKMQSFFGLYYTKQDVPYLLEIHRVRQFSFSIIGSSVFSLKNGLNLELSYNYASKSKGFIYNVGSTYRVNFALQKSVFHEKLSVQLAVNDIFFSSNPRISADLENFKTRFYQTYDNRNAKIQLTYKFGKSTFRRNDKRSSGADEENRARN